MPPEHARAARRPWSGCRGASGRRTPGSPRSCNASNAAGPGLGVELEPDLRDAEPRCEPARRAAGAASRSPTSRRARGGRARDVVVVMHSVTPAPPVRSRDARDAVVARTTRASSSRIAQRRARVEEGRGADADRASRRRAASRPRRRPSATPPVPMIGTPGCARVHVVHRAQRDRLDRRARQAAAASAEHRAAGARRRRAAPRTVFTSVSPVAPASSAAPAIVGEVGDVRATSFANTGQRRGRRRRTARDDVAGRAGVVGEHRRRRAARFGQLRLTSTATSSVGDRREQRAAAREVVDVVAPDRRDHARAACAQRGEIVRDPGSTPGPWRPTAFTIPPPVGCSRGGGLPAHANGASDFAVTAPSRAGSQSRATSSPCPKVPDAATIGFGELERARAGRACRPRRRRTAHRHTPSRSWPSRWYSCSERTVGSRAWPARRSRPRPRARRRPW